MTLSSTSFTARFRVLSEPERPNAASGDDRCPTVYWFNHAGGTTNTLAFRVRSDPPPRPMRLLTPRLPEREEDLDVTFDGDLEQLAQKFATQIAADFETVPADQRPPVVIIGHSYGGAVAYRVTKQLTRLGISPHRLVICSTRSPERLRYHKSLHTLDDAELIEDVDELFGGIPDNIRADPDALSFFVRALRHDLAIFESYVHMPGDEMLSVPITAICGTDDRAIDLADMQGWSRITQAAFRLRAIQGDHFAPLQRIAEVLEIATWDL
tara:strand:- start:2602 stop:3405 length:804 start_codon:yes stop_codon:yes gene_type:complete